MRQIIESAAASDVLPSDVASRCFPLKVDGSIRVHCASVIVYLTTLSLSGISIMYILTVTVQP